MTEVSNVTSVLPGALVQSLVTAVSDHGLGLQVLGYFDGTIDLHHLPTGGPSKKYKVGQKVKARVLYELPAASPPKFALSLADHVLNLQTKQVKGSHISESYPIGTILDSVKVVGVEGDHGVTMEVAPDVTGFIHVSAQHLSTNLPFL
jgi:rRNA biogenesis protein RRP5